MRFAIILIPAAILLALGLAALTLGGRGNDDARDVNPLSPPDADRVAPAAIADTPERWYRQPVVVGGEVVATGDEGRFALAGPRGAILVQAEPGVRDVARGERVDVYGVVNYVSRVQGERGRLGPVRTGAGAPFVSADGIRPAR